MDGKAVAFDSHGHALIEIDEAAERRLRWKIDLHVVPIVAFMYSALRVWRSRLTLAVWCFLDRTNASRIAAPL